MWHPVSVVAQTRRVAAAELTKFALTNQDKYGICVERGCAQVNTWHVDSLIADFKTIDDSLRK